MKRLILLCSCIFMSIFLNGQVIKSYVINIEGNKAYLDITTPKIKVGDVLSIREEAGYMVHPITKKKIKKEGGILADLEIVEVYGEYSVATIYPEEAIKKMKAGMVAEMPELPVLPPDEWEEEKENDVVEVNAPITADGIVKRYLEVSGLNKYMNRNEVSSFRIKGKISVTKKGKTEDGNSYIAVDLSTKKLYLKENDRALAINGNEGWFRVKGIGFGKYRKKALPSIWNSETDVFNVSYFNTLSWKREYLGDIFFKNKECSILKFTLRDDDSKSQMVIYFDKVTGLQAYSELSFGKYKFQTIYLEYKQFGNFILCSKLINSSDYGKGIIREETSIIEDICFDCHLDNSLFTKEAVKNAFKND